jgi:phosphatidylglycerophosphate synthase
MSHISIADIKASMNPEKRRSDGPWTRFVLRPLSYPGAWIFLRLGFSPNAVTYLSAVLCLTGFVCLAAGGAAAAWTGFAFFFVFGILDCVDGNMARVLGKASPWGEWVDALGGYTAYAAMLLGIGVAADASVGAILPGTGIVLPWPAGGWTLVGGAAAAANLLMRAVFQNYRVVKGASDERTGIGGEKRLSETIGITGFLVPVSALAYGFGLLPWVVLAYTVVYGGGCLVVVIKLIRRVESILRGGDAA